MVLYSPLCIMISDQVQQGVNRYDRLESVSSCDPMPLFPLLSLIADLHV